MSNTFEGNRLRARPEERFGSQENMIDLPEAIRKLRDEFATARHGHRQITLDQWGPVTMVLFAFEEGGDLADHQAAGVVTIQALEGELIVRTDEEEYRLSPNMMVVLAPNVRHSVVAVQASAMLLAVCLVTNNDQPKTDTELQEERKARGDLRESHLEDGRQKALAENQARSEAVEALIEQEDIVDSTEGASKGARTEGAV